MSSFRLGSVRRIVGRASCPSVRVKTTGWKPIPMRMKSTLLIHQAKPRDTDDSLRSPSSAPRSLCVTSNSHKRGRESFLRGLRCFGCGCHGPRGRAGAPGCVPQVHVSASVPMRQDTDGSLGSLSVAPDMVPGSSQELPNPRPFLSRTNSHGRVAPTSRIRTQRSSCRHGRSPYDRRHRLALVTCSDGSWPFSND